MVDHVKVELEIIQNELSKVGVKVPMSAISQWSVTNRARAEQWAIKKRWKGLKKPPCPKSHLIHIAKFPRPRVLNRWVLNSIK